MRLKRFAPEKIISMLRAVEVSLYKGSTVGHFRANLLRLAKAVWWNESQPGQAHERARS